MNKKFLFLVAILSILAFAVTVNAATFSVSPSSLTFTKSFNNTNLTFTNANASSALSLTFPSTFSIANDDSTDSLTFTLSSLGNTTPNNFVVNARVSTGPTDWKNFKTGKEYQTTVVFADSTGASNNVSLTVKIANDFCKYGEVGYITFGGVEDNTKDNEDEWVWHPLDNLKITINDVYNGFDKDKNIRVEYALYDSDGKKVDFGSIDTYSTLSIKEDNSKDVIFEFQIPADIDEGDYKLFVKAFVKGDEDAGCASKFDGQYYQEVSVEKQNDRAVVVDKNELDASFDHNVLCSGSVTIDARAYNTGSEDEDKVLVNIYNKELGINLYAVLNDLSQGDSDTASFTFNIPSNTAAKTYFLDLTTFYNYDDENSGCNKETDTACYSDNSKDDLDKQFRTALIVQGNCGATTKQDVSISAQLVTDEVIAGEQVKISATFTNTGNESTTYVVGLSGNENWSTIVSIEPQSFTLVPGENKNVEFILKLNQNVEGDQVFKVRALFNGITKEKLVSLSVQKAGSTGFNLPAIFQDNKLLFWVIVINVILVILIIIVAIKVARS